MIRAVAAKRLSLVSDAQPPAAFICNVQMHQKFARVARVDFALRVNHKVYSFVLNQGQEAITISQPARIPKSSCCGTLSLLLQRSRAVPPQKTNRRRQDFCVLFMVDKIALFILLASLFCLYF